MRPPGALAPGAPLGGTTAAGALKPYGREEQWVDGPGLAAQLAPGTLTSPAAAFGQPGGAAKPPAQQDMLYQWVDCPSYRPAAQVHQPYPQMPSPMYYPTPESPAYGMAPGVDPRHQGLGVGATDPSRGMGVYGQQDPRSPLGGRHLGMEDHRMGGHNDWYGGGDDGWSHNDGYQDHRGKGRGKGMRDGKGGDRKGQGRQQGMGGAGGGVTRTNPRSAEPGPDGQLAAVVESLGSSGIREMLSSALDSIYKDRIKPMANYVKGRLKERSCPEPVVKSFLELYAQHADLFNVEQPANADEASIFFKTEPLWFEGWIDIDSPNDPYEEVMWGELAKMLDSDRTFAGGRYGMARELMQMNLAFLAKYSLGEICQIVQLAIQHRKLIVYHRKMLKPIQTIMCQSPAATAKGSSTESEIKDMEQLCQLLFRMLIRHPEGIQLSRMKQVFKYEFSCVISEMAFQCTKLSELFSREPLVDTFKLETEDGGKSMYVRLNNPSSFKDNVKELYAKARADEAAQAAPLN